MYSGAGPGESARRPALVPRRLAGGGRGGRGRRGLWGRGVALGWPGRASGRGGPARPSGAAGTSVGAQARPAAGRRPPSALLPPAPSVELRGPVFRHRGGELDGSGTEPRGPRTATGRSGAVPRRAAALPIQVLIALRFLSGAGGRCGTPSHPRALFSGKVPENLKTPTRFPTPLPQRSGGPFTRGAEQTVKCWEAFSPSPARHVAPFPGCPAACSGSACPLLSARLYLAPAGPPCCPPDLVVWPPGPPQTSPLWGLGTSQISPGPLWCLLGA